MRLDFKELRAYRRYPKYAGESEFLKDFPSYVCEISIREHTNLIDTYSVWYVLEDQERNRDWNSLCLFTKSRDGNKYIQYEIRNKSYEILIDPKLPMIDTLHIAAREALHCIFYTESFVERMRSQYDTVELFAYLTTRNPLNRSLIKATTGSRVIRDIRIYKRTVNNEVSYLVLMDPHEKTIYYEVRSDENKEHAIYRLCGKASGEYKFMCKHEHLSVRDILRNYRTMETIQLLK